MKYLLLIPIFIFAPLFSESYAASSSGAIPTLEITPINHATFLLTWENKKLLVDPVGNFPEYEKMGNVDLILLTDVHGDHLDLNRLNTQTSNKTTIIAPAEVSSQLKEVKSKKMINLSNDKITVIDDFKITAIPMYNTSEERKKFHVKGRGNGYLIEKNGKRLYISGDTEDIPEMRNLKNIDVAFLCMNLPYTMTEEQAIDATIAFAPKEVYPFHYRGKKGDEMIFSDIEKYKKEVMKKNPKIEVKLLKWY